MAKHNITLIPGDGIGPEVTSATLEVLKVLKVDIEWDIVFAGAETYEKEGVLIPDNVYESINKTKVLLKGPIGTPIGTGFRSVNVYLRKKYDLYANIRPITNKYRANSDLIDFVIFRENTEGLYMGIEHKVDDDTFESVKRITRKGSTRIIKKAFEYAKENNISKVTVAHKANILKLTDGMFLDIAREVKKDYDIELEEVIVDNMAMQMVMNPGQFQVIVTMNLYGDILSDLGAGLVGGLGLIPSSNIGNEFAMFEAVHGSAPDIANKNLANPIAMILSSALMLKYLKCQQETKFAKH